MIKVNDWVETLVDKTYNKEGVDKTLLKGKKFRVVEFVDKDTIIVNADYDSIYGNRVKYKINEVKLVKNLHRFLMGDYIMVKKPIPLYEDCSEKIIAYLPVGVSASVCETHNDNEVMLEVTELVQTDYNFLPSCSNDYIQFFDLVTYKKQFNIGSQVIAVSSCPEEFLPVWCPWDEPGTIVKFIDDEKVLIEYIIDNKKYELVWSIHQIVLDNPVFKQNEYYKKVEEKFKSKFWKS